MTFAPEPPERAPSRLPALVDWWAARTPDALALADPHGTLSYAKLRAAIERAAAALAARGLRPGDRLLIVAENSIAAAVLLLAAQRLDAWPALVNARVAGAELGGMIELVHPRLVCYVTGHSGAAARHAEGRRLEPLLDLPFDERVLADPQPRPCAPEPVHAEPEEQVAVLIFTSGTIGAPKAVMHSHFALANLGRIMTRSRHTRPGDTYTGATPMAHIMGITNLVNALWAGASLRMLPRLDPAQVLDSIASGGMTHLSFVPTAYVRLLDHLAAHSVDLRAHRLRYISSGGAPLDPLLKERVEALFGLRLVNGYGMTECVPGTRTDPARESPPRSIGWPEEGVEARVADTNGAALGEGEVGELWLRTPTVMMGYYRDAEQTRAAFRPEGWYATGDLAKWLPGGELEIVGRCKEMIIRSGFNVYPAEVEQALNSLPGVLQSAVVGQREADGNERILAFVQPAAGAALDASALRAALRELIAPYKLPQQITLVDGLPIGPTGKIRKRLLVPDPA